MSSWELPKNAFLKRFHLDRFVKFFPLFVFALLLSRPEFFTVEDGIAWIIMLIFASFYALCYDLPLWIILEHVIGIFKGTLPERLILGFVTVNVYYPLVYTIEWYFNLRYWMGFEPVYFLGYLLPAFAISFSLVWFFARFSGKPSQGD